MPRKLSVPRCVSLAFRGRSGAAYPPYRAKVAGPEGRNRLATAASSSIHAREIQLNAPCAVNLYAMHTANGYCQSAVWRNRTQQAYFPPVLARVGQEISRGRTEPNSVRPSSSSRLVKTLLFRAIDLHNDTILNRYVDRTIFEPAQRFLHVAKNFLDGASLVNLLP